ncbi:MAG: hypothetical protein IT445_11440 [Phycisphaeraceae bacterium]|nr:hypothetical protein [Phycisphaeraceae bacterium]
MSDSYLTVAEAREWGASLPGTGVTTLMAKTDEQLGVLLFAASLDIDAAMPYQGVKYDASGDQVREFPRYQRVVTSQQPAPPEWAVGQGLALPVAGIGVWDWDSDTDTAVVPDQVKIACLYQAASLCDESFQGRLDAIRSGLASQSVGSMSESYLKPTDLPGGLSGLCDRAQRLMDRYRLRSAPLL